ncbi:30S ribosomal protein S6e [Candidatus Woesearchaeota archaeon]|nr:30S ribosomal protein S6e [Candidatus Woesearchaeota archaeon]
MEIKVNIGDAKTKKTYNKTLTEENITPLIGKRIGDIVKGESLELPAGYELEVRGGSDNAGFPMRKDVTGSGRKKILIVGGVGMKNQGRKGLKLRKMVAGNTIGEKTAQINLKVVKWGKEPIEKVEEPAAEEPKAE